MKPEFVNIRSRTLVPLVGELLILVYDWSSCTHGEIKLLPWLHCVILIKWSTAQEMALEEHSMGTCWLWIKLELYAIAAPKDVDCSEVFGMVENSQDRAGIRCLSAK